MKNNTKLIIAAAIGGAGFLVYKNWDKISNMFKKKEEVKPEEEIVKNTPPKQNVEKTYTDYEKKVMKLQAVVGTGVDGVVGKNTNNAVKAYFPNTYAKLGDVTSANIDAYLALGSKKQIIDTTLSDIKARGKAIWAAMSSGKKATIIRDGNVRAVYYDGVNKTYPTTGATFVLKQGGVLDKSKSVLLTDGFIVTEQFVYKSNGSNEGVRRIKVDPRILNVI